MAAIIQGQRQRSENTTFQQIKLGRPTSVIPRFSMIFTGKSISDIILIIQSHCQGHS